MKKRIARYRLEIDYLSKDYPEWALSTSSPIYTKKDGLRQYMQAIKTETCADDETRPARVHLWKYAWNERGQCCPVTIAKNY